MVGFGCIKMLNNEQQRLEGFKPSKRYTSLKINFLRLLNVFF
jgi:hypothetical protein